MMPFDTSPDIEDPKAGDQFMPAVGYMPQCEEYRNSDGSLSYGQNAVALRATCKLTVQALANLPGLTFKYAVTLDDSTLKDWQVKGARNVARAGGSWMDRALEEKAGAKYRILFGTPAVAPEGTAIEVRYTVQRISDGKIMRVQPRGGSSRYAGEAAKNFAEQIRRVLNDPASVPPLWHSPF